MVAVAVGYSMRPPVHPPSPPHHHPLPSSTLSRPTTLHSTPPSLAQVVTVTTDPTTVCSATRLPINYPGGAVGWGCRCSSGAGRDFCLCLSPDGACCSRMQRQHPFPPLRQRAG